MPPLVTYCSCYISPFSCTGQLGHYRLGLLSTNSTFGSPTVLAVHSPCLLAFTHSKFSIVNADGFFIVTADGSPVAGQVNQEGTRTYFVCTMYCMYF